MPCPYTFAGGFQGEILWDSALGRRRPSPQRFQQIPISDTQTFAVSPIVSEKCPFTAPDVIAPVFDSIRTALGNVAIASGIRLEWAVGKHFTTGQMMALEPR